MHHQTAVYGGKCPGARCSVRPRSCRKEGDAAPAADAPPTARSQQPTANSHVPVQRACKPDSVPPLAERRQSSISTPCHHDALAANPGVITGRAPILPYLALLQVGFTRPPCYQDAGALLPHLFTLTRANAGGMVSVALSVGSRRPGVTWHLARWSPDFPLQRDAAATARPAGPAIGYQLPAVGRQIQF